MKWYVIPALITCGLNSMLAAIVLCLAAFHLLTDKSTNAPIEPNEDWISLVKWLSIFSTFWLILSIAGMYVSMSKRQSWKSTVILILFALCFGISVYFNVTFGNQLDMKEVGSDILFRKTVDDIANNKGDTWIPAWLDNVQKQSKVCCGIMTYRDYEEFWPSTPSRIPRSCCKDSKTIPSSCPTDVNLIPFPNTPSDFVKVEMGCMQEILEAVRHHIRESYQNSVIMTVFVACGILAFLVLHTKLYLEGVEYAAAQQQKDIAQGGGDGRDFEVQNMNQNAILNAGSGPLIISSSGQMGSIDSFDGIPTFGSIDSFPGQGVGGFSGQGGSGFSGQGASGFPGQGASGFPVRQYISDQATLQMQYRQQQLAAQMQQQPNIQQFQLTGPQQSVQVPLPILQQQQAFQAMQMQQLPQQWQIPQQAQQMQQPSSGPRSNKDNMAISNLQQQRLQQQSQQRQNEQNQQLQKQQLNEQLQQQRQSGQLQQQRPNDQIQRQNDQLQQQRPNDQQQRQNGQLQQQRPNEQLQQQRLNDQLQQQQQNQNQQYQMQTMQSQNQSGQFQPQKPLLQSPQFMDTSLDDDNLGIIPDGGNAPQREPYTTVSGAVKSADREQSNQIPNMGRNFMQPLLPMGTPEVAVNDNNVARTEQQQQTQDAPVISPPGSPTGRRKKVRKEALANRNNK